MKTNIKKLIESIKKLSNKDLNELLKVLNEDKINNHGSGSMESFIKFWGDRNVIDYMGYNPRFVLEINTSNGAWDLGQYSYNEETPGWDQVYYFLDTQDIGDLCPMPDDDEEDTRGDCMELLADQEYDAMIEAIKDYFIERDIDIQLDKDEEKKAREHWEWEQQQKR